jgi:hypothetical protein
MKEANLHILGELHRAGKYQSRRRVPQQPPALGASAWQHPGWDLPDSADHAGVVVQDVIRTLRMS